MNNATCKFVLEDDPTISRTASEVARKETHPGNPEWAAGLLEAGRKRLLLSVRRLEGAMAEPQSILLAMKEGQP